MKVRSPVFTLDDTIPKHWFFGHPTPTHLANSLSLVFPAGERFFVRSVRHFQERVKDDAVLAADVRTFFGQEGRHASVHDDYIEMLERQGYSVRPFIKFYEAVCFGLVERAASPELRLAATAACEHFTALLAEEALTAHQFTAAHPVIAQLLLWHASEEVEHRNVAFDVLRKVAPGYPLRLAGMAVGGSLLGSFWLLGTLWLLAQERSIPEPSPALQAFRKDRGSPARVFAKGIRSYLRRDFHPSELGGDEAAAAFLATLPLREKSDSRAASGPDGPTSVRVAA